MAIKAEVVTEVVLMSDGKTLWKNLVNQTELTLEVTQNIVFSLLDTISQAYIH